MSRGGNSAFIWNRIIVAKHEDHHMFDKSVRCHSVQCAIHRSSRSSQMVRKIASGKMRVATRLYVGLVRPNANGPVVRFIGCSMRATSKPRVLGAEYL